MKIHLIKRRPAGMAIGYIWCDVNPYRKGVRSTEIEAEATCKNCFAWKRGDTVPASKHLQGVFNKIFRFTK